MRTGLITGPLIYIVTFVFINVDTWDNSFIITWTNTSGPTSGGKKSKGVHFMAFHQLHRQRCFIYYGQKDHVVKNSTLKGNCNLTKVFNFTYSAYWAGRLQQLCIKSLTLNRFTGCLAKLSWTAPWKVHLPFKLYFALPNRGYNRLFEDPKLPKPWPNRVQP